MSITYFPVGLQRPHCLMVLLCLIFSNLTDVRVVNSIFCAFHPTWKKIQQLSFLHFSGKNRCLCVL